MEHGVGVNKLQLHLGASNSVSSILPLTSEQMSPLLSNEREDSEDIQQEPSKELPKLLDNASYLIHLAVFGILGVLTRYTLDKLFGPSVGHVTSDQTILYLDLPSNMVGSFLMGWFGVVFKEDISNVSKYLAVALTTGYLGSLTTFSGWNQKMLELSVTGNWLFVVLGFLIGLFLVAFSIIFGIETAKGFRWLLTRLNVTSGSETSRDKTKAKVEAFKHHLVVMLVFLLILGLLWGVSGVLMIAEFKNGENAYLWIACIVGPLGVWIRWLLSRLNGHGLGSRGLLSWMRFGTLTANVSAACIMAALATTKIYVNTRDCDTIVKGIQFGLFGCLSTVSTFVAEFNEMRESEHPWRAYVYTIITICSSFFLGILIYSVPIWRMDEI
ncbi:putative fluoride ion transporter CrcB [Medicago truncatula]|uniref:Putative fluoride ion transporter CrcB n=1 Tax=Medicago truncatula TaxID=3880 RepID=A0A396IQV3_MEDTR|nr:fluoride export protein 1 isoform X2 [Medicago truncatula]RHN65307.1 putative fluoride ion transporter CrcB [Medicago truncatula]